MERHFKLTLNGKFFDDVKVTNCTTPAAIKDDIIKYVKTRQSTFDEARDILEITDITPPQLGMIIHTAQGNQNNKYVDAIISRHITNLVATYGKDQVMKLITDIYGKAA